MPSKRNRIFIGILLIYAAGLAFFMRGALGDIDPRYRESAEESLVETSQLMASLIEQDVSPGTVNDLGAIDTTRLAPVFQSLYARRFSAQIYSVHKTRVDLRVYVTDKSGRVLFDSLAQHTGEDFSQWRDVALALRGEYGARTTADVPGRAESNVMYVGAPIRTGQGAAGGTGQIIGAVSVGKPVQSFGQFVAAARQKTLVTGLVSALAVLLLAVFVAVWLVRPLGLVTDYVKYVREQRTLSLPRLARRALRAIGAAFDEMRDTLAGRSYVADYVQTLTHEVKSPLSAIRGAAELLQEPGMGEAQRALFLANIERETRRIQELVNRMMELTALETRRVLDQVEPVPLNTLLHDAVSGARDAAMARSVALHLEVYADAAVEGDAFLLRQAISNLLDNAIDFAPPHSEVRMSMRVNARVARITVRDHGPGIPDYAQGKLFEKFYSLARPHSQKKSTGLGLAFVKEIAALHRGRIELANAPDGGAIASLQLPVSGGPG